MLEGLEGLWSTLPVDLQDGLYLVFLLIPTLVVAALVLVRLRPWPLVGAMLWRYRWTNLLFVLLIGVAVGVAVGVIAQERGLRQGTARAADKFDLVVTAPGSEIQMTLATVFLQPSDVPLLDGAMMAEITDHPNVDLAVPLSFGDSYRGQPIVGTTAPFVAHLSGTLADGRMFETQDEAVVGANVPVEIGYSFTPAHGLEAGRELHEGASLTVVGRMPLTGSPWDRAILTPIEGVWAVHGLSRGHPPDQPDRIGPPFDPDYFPGTQAILVRADELWANHALRSEFTRAGTMAFLPGAVLAQLYTVLGDVRQIMSVLAMVAQVLVAVGVMASLIIFARLFARRLAVLRALGAPRRFVFSVVWSYAASLIVAGSALGLAIGFAATSAISRVISERTDILITSRLGWVELHLIGAFISATLILALLPALNSISRPVVADLRD